MGLVANSWLPVIERESPQNANWAIPPLPSELAAINVETPAIAAPPITIREGELGTLVFTLHRLKMDVKFLKEMMNNYKPALVVMDQHPAIAGVGELSP